MSQNHSRPFVFLDVYPYLVRLTTTSDGLLETVVNLRCLCPPWEVSHFVEMDRFSRRRSRSEAFRR